MPLPAARAPGSNGVGMGTVFFTVGGEPLECVRLNRLMADRLNPGFPCIQLDIPAGPSRQQQINALIGEINGEEQNYNTNETYANAWDSRGESFRACEYYQKMIYNLGVLMTKYEKLGALDGSYGYRDKIDLRRQNRDTIYKNENDMCLDVKYHLSY